MRRSVAVETSLALLLAFLLAPFQHVHPDHPHEGHLGEIHAHFFVAHSHAERKSCGGIQVEAEDDDDDDHAHARSVDTYTLVLPDGPQALFPSPVAIAPPVGKKEFPPPEFIEARANSPPLIDRSAPRAPPL